MRIRRSIRFPIIGTLGLLCFHSLETAASAALLIATGWDEPTPAQFRDSIAAFEHWAAFDGCAIKPLRTNADGKEAGASFAFVNERWEWSGFAASVRDLKAARPVHATNNFLLVHANPGDVDWFDDAGWREIVEHWRLLARVARQGGLRGLLFDPEPYAPPASQFSYGAQPQQDRHSFADYRAKARQRGRETIQAVAAEFPDAVVLSYFFFGLFGRPPEHPDALAGHGYGLLPAYIDGWLDAAPPGLRFIDGNESAYGYTREEDFNRAFTHIKTRMTAFVAPENHDRCRAQVLVGHGIYLDAHVNPTNSPWHIERRGRSPAQCLVENAAAALAAADGIVWIYGEKGHWWPHGRDEAWPVRLPDADRALRLARDPDGFARATIAVAPAADNLLRNPSFSSTNESGGVADWWTWQDNRATGRFAAVRGEAQLTGMSNGVFGQSTPARPGEFFAVSARVLAGGGSAGVTVRWKSPEGRWVHELLDRRLVATGPADTRGARTVCGLVQVPSGAGEVVVLLFAEGQTGPDDAALFDDVALVRIAPLR